MDTRTSLEKTILVLLFFFLAVLTMKQLGSEDIGFHMRTGEYILSGFGWPQNDPFTYTISDHPYINPSWGYDVIVALLYRITGVAGIVILHGVLILMTFYMVLRTARLSSASTTIIGFVFFLGCIASEIRFYARPEIISYLMLATVLYILHKHAANKGSYLWMLVPVHLLWANLHSLFILGWLAELSFITGLAVRNKKLDYKLLLYSAASFAVVFANPYGWRGVLHVLTLATRFQGGQVVRESIGELISPYALRISEQYPFYPQNSIFAFRAFAFLSIVALFPFIRRKRLEVLALWAISFYLSFKMIRNIPIYVITNIPVMAWGLSSERFRLFIGKRFPNKRIWMSNAFMVLLGLASIAFGLRVVHNAYYIDDRRTERFGLGWNRLALPIDATNFVQQRGIHTPMLNDLKFGGYLMWALRDPVFIDGRMEVVGDEFFEKYARMMGDPAFLEQEVGEYGINWIIFDYMWNMPLLGRLSSDPRWDLIFLDSVSAIFVRKNNLQQASALPTKLLAPVDGNWSSPGIPGIQLKSRPGRVVRWMTGIWNREAFPLDEYNVGLFHFSRGEMPQAARCFSRAIQLSDGYYYEIYYNLGLTLDQLGRYEEAQQCFRVVLQDEPRNVHALERVMN